MIVLFFVFFFSSRRRHTRFDCDWSSDVCSSDLFREHPPLARTELPSVTAVTVRVDDEHHSALPRPLQIGRASCREKCRSRWSPYHQKKKKHNEHVSP